MKYLENQVNSALGYDSANTARSLAEFEYFVPSCHCDFFFFFSSGSMHQQDYSVHQQGYSGHQQQLKMCHNLIQCLISISWTPLKAPPLSILGRDFGVDSRISRRSPVTQNHTDNAGRSFLHGMKFLQGTCERWAGQMQLQWMEMGNLNFILILWGIVSWLGSSRGCFCIFKVSGKDQTGLI